MSALFPNDGTLPYRPAYFVAVVLAKRISLKKKLNFNFKFNRRKLQKVSSLFLLLPGEPLNDVAFIRFSGLKLYVVHSIMYHIHMCMDHPAFLFIEFTVRMYKSCTKKRHHNWCRFQTCFYLVIRLVLEEFVTRSDHDHTGSHIVGYFTAGNSSIRRGVGYKLRIEQWP
jgi:hypothetical protein